MREPTPTPGRVTAVGRLMAPLVRFLHVESSGGVVLLACTVVALVLANSPLAAHFHAFWQVPVGITVGDSQLIKPLLFWINDGLMTLFFFVVGLEIKREMLCGELADPRKALLPVVAAVGGMLVPAAFYALALRGGPGSHGWGVPMATDIAFVVGFLTLLGPRVPTGLKVLLLTLAIADDIGAILVIAVAYSTGLSLIALGLAAAGLAVMALLLHLGVRSSIVFAVLVTGIWLGFLKSGVHPTVAGVLFGLLTPYAAAKAVSPLERLEDVLHPWVAFAIMPLFALANAGVDIGEGMLGTPVALAVVAGLVLGKPLGIILLSWASVRLRLTRLPEGVTWKVLIGAGCLGGIGFTMSLFIAGLGLEGAMLNEAKIGILTGSALSAALGCVLLLVFLPHKLQT